MKKPTKPGTLVSRPQVRKILQSVAAKEGRTISKQRVHALEDTEDFPAPVDVLEDGQGRPMPAWDKAEIDYYALHRSTAAGRPAAPVEKS